MFSCSRSEFVSGPVRQNKTFEEVRIQKWQNEQLIFDEDKLCTLSVVVSQLRMTWLIIRLFNPRTQSSWLQSDTVHVLISVPRTKTQFIQPGNKCSSKTDIWNRNTSRLSPQPPTALSAQIRTFHSEVCVLSSHDTVSAKTHELNKTRTIWEDRFHMRTDTLAV